MNKYSYIDFQTYVQLLQALKKSWVHWRPDSAPFGDLQSIQDSNGTYVVVEISLNRHTCACRSSKFDPLLSQGLDLLHPDLGCGVR